ncbi:MAG: FAD-dependent oxidoreductase [Oligoflexia bacterium]|nr:FAD-dependent oxidoreductase [Oligoflexia bacterium]
MKESLEENKHHLPGLDDSCWLLDPSSNAQNEVNYPSLDRDKKTEIAILGGGIAGITCAILLKKKGKKVTLIEAGKIARGVSAQTTAHVSVFQSFLFDYLTTQFGAESAKTCAESQLLAIETLFNLIKEYNIECGAKRSNAYAYAVKREDVNKIKSEFTACKHAGLAVSYLDSSPLPFPTYGSICYPNQGQINPRQYLLALASSIPDENGSSIFENTIALEIKENEKKENNNASNAGIANYEIKTDKGIIYAEKVIVATHFPFPSNGLFFARMKVARSYALGIRISDELPDELYYSSTDPYYYIRTYQDQKGKLVIIGGEDHLTGEERNTLECFQSIKNFAFLNFNVKSIDYSWSTQDNYPFDELPYIGRVSKDNPHLYVATGFSGSGMVYGTLSAMIITELITASDDLISKSYKSYEELYAPYRLNMLASGKEFFLRNFHVAEMFITDRVSSKSKVKNTEEILPGQGAIVHNNNKDLAIYKSEDKSTHILSPTCTHLGCRVRFNHAERTWDCPCHGSRYNFDGKILHGPALKNLERGIKENQ